MECYDLYNSYSCTILRYHSTSLMSQNEHLRTFTRYIAIASYTYPLKTEKIAPVAVFFRSGFYECSIKVSEMLPAAALVGRWRRLHTCNRPGLDNSDPKK